MLHYVNDKWKVGLQAVQSLYKGYSTKYICHSFLVNLPVIPIKVYTFDQCALFLILYHISQVLSYMTLLIYLNDHYRYNQIIFLVVNFGNQDRFLSSLTKYTSVRRTVIFINLTYWSQSYFLPTELT